MWCSTRFTVVCERLGDRQGQQSIVKGFFSMLEPLFGHDAFGPNGTRFAPLLDGFNLATASAFEQAWDQLEQEAHGAGVSGPLDKSARQAGAGRNATSFQRQLTRQLEQICRDALHRRIVRLDPADPRRESWMSAHKQISPAAVACSSGRPRACSSG